MADSENKMNQAIVEDDPQQKTAENDTVSGNFNGKKLTAKIVNKAITGTRFIFGTSSKIANSGVGFAQDMASYFSGVNTSTPVGDTLFACGQTLTSTALNRVQALIAKAEKDR